MFNVAVLTPILQTLFTTTADELARQTHFTRRRGQFTGADFLQALTFGYLKRRNAPLEALAQPLGISRQALDQRLQKPAADFCRLALPRAVGHLVEAQPAVVPLLEHFQGVFVDDCTQARMPDEAADAFAGCNAGNPAHGKAGLKVLVRWEIRRGNLHHVGLHPARTSDHVAQAQAPPLPPGALHLADLGFADFERLGSEARQGIFWVTRLPAQARLYPAGGSDEALARRLRRWRGQGVRQVGLAAAVGNKDSTRGRLVAFVCPAEVAARRRARARQEARRRGRLLSERQRELCHWTVLFTNVPAGWLSAEQVWAVYRLRWQIELLFKRFKSEGGLDETSSAKRYRVECEWYVKLLGQGVRHWMQLLGGGPLRDVNAGQVGRVVTDHLQRMAEALQAGQGLEETLARLQQELRKVRKRTARRSRRPASQVLEELTLVA